jgi:hypothetical protein
VWAGVVAEKSGDVRECALAGPRRGRGGGGANLTGQAHDTEREKGTRGATAQQLANRAHEAEREEGHGGEETSAARLAPLGSERERGLPLTGGVRQSGGAGARPGWAELGRLGCISFFFFSGFSNSFLFLFYRVFNSKFKLGFKFK